MWLKINVQDTQLVRRGKSSLLIKMNSNSDFCGYCFWHPAKLVRPDSVPCTYSLSFTDDWVFNLVEYGKGMHNRSEITAEMQIPADQMLAAFEAQSSAINRAAKEQYNNRREHIFTETVIPDKISFPESAPDDSLIR